MGEVNLKCTHGNKSSIVLIPMAEIQDPDLHCLVVCVLQAQLANCAGTEGHSPDVLDILLLVVKL